VAATAPSAISIALSGASQVDGYYSGPVTATVTGPTGLSYTLDGSPSTPVTGPITISGEGAHQLNVTDSAADSANQLVLIDSAPPVITNALTPSPTGSGWVPGGSTLAIAAADAGSGLAALSYSSTGAQTTSSTTVSGSSASIPLTVPGTSTFTVTATDNVGNVASQQVVVNVDGAAPTISCATPDGQWHSADVTIPCTASDAQSGLANPSQSSFSLTTKVAPGTETSNASTNVVVVCDAVGNCATAGPITGLKVDKKGPSISITRPASTIYALGQSVTASYQCSDGGSGVASCLGTVANGAPLSTATAGTKTFTVTATDEVGNTSSQTVSYTVGVKVCLPSKPTRYGPSEEFLLELCDSSGHNITTSATTVTAVSVDGTTTPIPFFWDPTNAFQFAPWGDFDFYILNVSSLSSGNHTLWISIGGAAPQAISFKT
jgi:hypothetical protein